MYTCLSLTLSLSISLSLYIYIYTHVYNIILYYIISHPSTLFAPRLLAGVDVDAVVDPRRHLLYI